MSILDELLKSLDGSELDEKMKIICDQIMDEERPKFKLINDYPEPIGPNIFLSIQFDSKNKKDMANYICLEREEKENYIISHYKNNRRVKIWNINENKVEKILKCFAEKLKFIKGE